MNTRRMPSAVVESGVEDLAARTPHQTKERRCLTCSGSFTSAWSGERVCLRCKSSSVWRGGADVFA